MSCKLSEELRFISEGGVGCSEYKLEYNKHIPTAQQGESKPRTFQSSWDGTDGTCHSLKTEAFRLSIIFLASCIMHVLIRLLLPT